MKIIEKLNENTYLATRESSTWKYRIIITTNENLEIGKSYSRKDNLNISVSSLCEEVSNFLGIEHDDQVSYDEAMKEDALEIFRGELSEEDFRMYNEEN